MNTTEKLINIGFAKVHESDHNVYLVRGAAMATVHKPTDQVNGVTFDEYLLVLGDNTRPATARDFKPGVKIITLGKVFTLVRYLANDVWLGKTESGQERFFNKKTVEYYRVYL